MNKIPILQSKRLLFKGLSSDDSKHIIDLYSKKENIIFFDNQEIKTLKDAEHFIDFWNKRFEANKSIRWKITLQNGKFIGIAGFNFMNNHYAKLGFCVHINEWNKGCATEIVKEILKYGFNILNLNRIEADHFLENTISGKVLLKNNFVQEGIFRQKRFENNKYHDVVVYGILKKDWIRNIK